MNKKRSGSKGKAAWRHSAAAAKKRKTMPGKGRAALRWVKKKIHMAAWWVKENIRVAARKVKKDSRLAAQRLKRGMGAAEQRCRNHTAAAARHIRKGVVGAAGGVKRTAPKAARALKNGLCKAGSACWRLLLWFAGLFIRLFAALSKLRLREKAAALLRLLWRLLRRGAAALARGLRKLPPRRSMDARLALPVLLLLPLPAAWLARYTETDGALGWCFGNPGAWLLEALLLLIPALLLFAASGSLCASWCVSALTAFAFGLVSQLKAAENGTVLTFADTTMEGSMGEILKYTDFRIYGAMIYVPILILLIALLLGWFDSRLRRQRIHRKLRLSALPVAGLLFVLLFCGKLGNSWSLAVAGGEDVSSLEFVGKHGAALGMYYGYNNHKNFVPVADEETMDRLIEELEQQPEELPTESEELITPNIIFLMSESFFDVTELPNVSFSEDPLPNFHRLAESCSSGKFLTNTYCGGTAYVEMEVLTGLCSQFLADGDRLTTLEPKTVYSGMPCITEVLLGYGYETTFLHSHNKELYNRSVIYPQLGFDNVIFSDEFRHTEKAGGYISDQALTEELLRLCERAEGPRFIFAVSMENHQPYTDKYEETRVKAESGLLSDTAIEVLENYTQGVYDADAALGSLTDMLAQREEPYMVVFFGDHRPNLQTEKNSTVYSELGFSSAADTSTWEAEELAEMLSTNYLIWTNYEEPITEEAAADCAESCTFLGLNILNRLGFGLSDYYSWLSRVVEPQMLLYRPRLFIDRAGSCSADVPKEQNTCVQGYQALVQNIVYGDNSMISHSVNRIQATKPEPPQLVAHAGGAIYGYRLTNSLEALDAAYEHGFRYFELDFSLTSDGHLVCIHDWDSMAERMLGYAGRQTLSEFRHGTYFAGLTLLDVGDVVAWLESHPDCYIITDCKEGNADCLPLIHDAAGMLRNRFIPQIYSFGEYETALSSGFTNIILTLYELGSSKGVAEFAAENPLWAVTIPESLMTEKLIQTLTEQGVPTYCHTINDLSSFEKWQTWGLTGIYTDYFEPNHMGIQNSEFRIQNSGAEETEKQEKQEENDK